jgi:predicted unusual protein kinase regulating ubiquinone biosynthesis (AarF/ABC1/UbiB family)
MLARFLYHLPTRHKKRVLQHLVHAGLSTDEAHAAPMAKKIFIHFTKTVALGASKMA